MEGPQRAPEAVAVETMRRQPPSSKHHTLHGSEIVEFPVLLQNLCDARRSGTLVVDGERSLCLYLREGSLAAAYDGDPEFLAKALVKTRALAGRATMASCGRKTTRSSASKT